MAFFRPRVSRESEVRYLADLELGKAFPQLLQKAREAEEALRRGQSESLTPLELRRLGLEFDNALTDALRAAEAAARATYGPKSYEDRIRRRKARATPEGKLWTDEVSRLRTLRETHRLQGIARTPRLAA
ncbi:hypothetical protein [Bailinhaonella thermotolerans]|uniref:Uncharacterized protein n=1 Tax=Bailinhaonella thermotolerans TaxID=1070861 RepID=A0A3A4A0Z2_9ACTN|nr:hypothetical protein [Bailinhaonella thermotolerans]RJL20841.1 hypothetical protein D5H75_39010 [Bailinhaonella thermotolerans]